MGHVYIVRFSFAVCDGLFGIIVEKEMFIIILSDKFRYHTPNSCEIPSVPPYINTLYTEVYIYTFLLDMSYFKALFVLV